MKYPDKSQLELLQEFEDNGYVHHNCPDCGWECNATEVDSSKAYCENCDESKTVEPAI